MKPIASAFLNSLLLTTFFVGLQLIKPILWMSLSPTWRLWLLVIGSTVVFGFTFIVQIKFRGR